MNVKSSSFGLGDAVCAIYSCKPETNFYTKHKYWFEDVVGINFFDLALSPSDSKEAYSIDSSNKKFYQEGISRKQVYSKNIGSDEVKKPLLKRYWKAIDNKTVVIAPNTSGWQNREWGFNNFRELTNQLSERGYDVVIIGTGVKQAYYGYNCKNLFIDKSPQEVINLLLRCHLFVGCDSGIAHIAGMYNVPSVVIMDEFIGFDCVFSMTESIRNAKGTRFLSQISVNDVLNTIESMRPQKSLKLSDLTCLNVHKTEQNKIRIGSKHDGGYVVIDSIGEYDALVSCGIGGNVDFEKHFLELHKGLKCFMFDGTVDSLPEKVDGTFTKKNIGTSNNETTTDLSQLTMKLYDVFLKMDIEGGEWQWLEEIGSGMICKFKQMVFEFHDLISPEQVSIINKILKTHILVHAHGNNYGGTFSVGKSILPETLELTFVRKDIDTSKELVEKLPIEQDSPNNVESAEIILSSPFTRK